MYNFCRLLVMIICFCACGALAADPATKPAAYEIVKGEGFGIAVPQDWRNIPIPSPKLLLFRQGDGVGVPSVDDTGEPLQIGITVEKSASNQSLKERGDALIKAASANSRLKSIGTPKLESLKLADGADAMLLSTEFIKEQTRHSLQLKLLTNDAKGNAFVASAFVVGGKDSKWEVPDSALAQWVRSYLATFVIDSTKVNTSKIPAPFDPASAQ